MKGGQNGVMGFPTARELKTRGNEFAEYTYLTAWPVAWIGQALKLKLSATKLLEADEAGSLDSALLLEALAFENLLKGIYMSKVPDLGPIKVTSIVSLPHPFHTHSLTKLADQAQLVLSKDERSTLSALSDYSVWRGRYLVPVKFADYCKPVKKSGFYSWGKEKQREQINLLWFKLLESPSWESWIIGAKNMTPEEIVERVNQITDAMIAASKGMSAVVGSSLVE